MRALVSIHAPRVGRDEYIAVGMRYAFRFNPRAPCGARRERMVLSASVEPFQSTRPVWGATLVIGKVIEDLPFQSTRPVWGATQGAGEIYRCI